MCQSQPPGNYFIGHFNDLIITIPSQVLPEYILHILFNFLFLLAGEWFSIALNAPLIAYHIHR